MSRSPSSKLVIALLGALACTLGGSDAEPRPNPEAASPAVPELEPEPKLAEPELAEPVPELLPADTPAVPGFVLYTADQTIIVPSDGSPYTIGEGLWLQDDSVSPAALRHTLILDRTRANIMALPRCSCLALEGACENDSLESRSFDARTGALVDQPQQPCSCMRRHEIRVCGSYEANGETFEAFKADEDQVVSSLVGGWLLYQGWAWNSDCHYGMNTYEATAERRELIAEPPELTSRAMRSLGCSTHDNTLVAATRSWPIDGRLDNDCEDDFYESESFMLRRGHLWAVRDTAGTHENTRWYLKRPVRPESCPSSNDPCGDPEPYRARAELDRRQTEYWIATDGSAALTAERHEYTLWRSDSATSFEFELPNIDASTDVIGVRVHADLGRLRALIGEHPTLGIARPERASTTVEASACLEHVFATEPKRSAREHGEACFEHINFEQWTAAEAECLQGLAVAEQPATRGAILYNLGLIAEAEGARAQAVVYYRESLAVRPNNRAVERRLARLELP